MGVTCRCWGGRVFLIPDNRDGHMIEEKTHDKITVFLEFYSTYCIPRVLINLLIKKKPS